jgi:hypothetical protein
VIDGTLLRQYAFLLVVISKILVVHVVVSSLAIGNST